MTRSVRMSILEQALADVTERLAERPVTRESTAFTALLKRYQAEYDTWAQHAPDEAQRAALVKSVLELNVRVMRAGARAAER